MPVFGVFSFFAANSFSRNFFFLGVLVWQSVGRVIWTILSTVRLRGGTVRCAGRPWPPDCVRWRLVGENGGSVVKRMGKMWKIWNVTLKHESTGGENKVNDNSTNQKNDRANTIKKTVPYHRPNHGRRCCPRRRVLVAGRLFVWCPSSCGFCKTTLLLVRC